VARSLQTSKSIYFSTEQKYKKKTMVQILEARGMLNEEAKNYILRGIN
jgi:hypothetical protein